MNKYVKQQFRPFCISTLSLFGSILIEPYIQQDDLALLVLIIAVTISAVLWKQLQNKQLIIMVNLFALVFHIFRDIVLIRQFALTILIAGILVGLLHLLGFEEPKDRD